MPTPLHLKQQNQEQLKLLHDQYPELFENLQDGSIDKNDNLLEKLSEKDLDEIVASIPTDEVFKQSLESYQHVESDSSDDIDVVEDIEDLEELDYQVNPDEALKASNVLSFKDSYIAEALKQQEDAYFKEHGFIMNGKQRRFVKRQLAKQFAKMTSKKNYVNLNE